MPPVKIDIYAILTLLGIIQGFFLTFFFLSKEHRKIASNKYLGFLILSVSVVCFDSFLGYSNYMFKLLYLVDFSEPVNFLIAPFYYLFIRSKLENQSPRYGKYHLIPALLYLLYSPFFHVSDLNYKFNAYISAYHPEMDFKTSLIKASDPLYLKKYIVELVILSCIIYSGLILYRIRAYKNLATNNPKLLRFVSLLAASFLFTVAVLIGSKLTYYADLGDHFITITITLTIYLITIYVVKHSLFFHEEKDIKKYEKSSLDEEMKARLLKKLHSEMSENHYFLNHSCSLPELAERIGSTPNHVSQVINECLGETFFDLLARYRIEEAKPLILEGSQTIDDIAFTVGYNSKTAFYKAFKKITGLTPSEFRKKV